MASTTAYLLISHGSRDPRPQVAMNRLAQFVRECLQHQTLEKQYLSAAAKSLALNSLQATRLSTDRSQPAFRQLPDKLSSRSHRSGASARIADPSAWLKVARRPTRSPLLSLSPIVGTACLELGNRPLEDQICDFGCRAKAAGASLVKLVPVFLMQGVHVMDDLPQAANHALQRLKSVIDIELCPHVGSHLGLHQILAERLAAVTSGASLLVAHGSRRSGGNKPIEAIARQIHATAAYWSVSPDVETQTIDLMQQGHQRIAILPYFLFTGGITDAITQRTEELAERFPKVAFRLLPPIGASRDLAKVVVDLAT